MDATSFNETVCERLATAGDRTKEELESEMRQNHTGAASIHIRTTLTHITECLRRGLRMFPLITRDAITGESEPLTENQLLAAIDLSIGDVVRMSDARYEAFITAEAPSNDAALRIAHQFRNRLAAELPKIVSQTSQELGN